MECAGWWCFALFGWFCMFSFGLCCFVLFALPFFLWTVVEWSGMERVGR